MVCVCDQCVHILLCLCHYVILQTMRLERIRALFQREKKLIRKKMVNISKTFVQGDNLRSYIMEAQRVNIFLK